MKRKNDQSWKPLAHLLSACGIPWIWYLADFIFSLLISMVTVRLPQMTGAITVSYTHLSQDWKKRS